MQARKSVQVALVGIVCTCVILVSVGCGDTLGSRYSGTVVRDSAGIQMVEVGAVDDRVAFQLADDPEFIVGWGSGDYPFQFLRRGYLLSDGRAAVADFGTQQVLILSYDGQVEQTLGGAGEGPGELSSLSGMTVYGSDTIVTQDTFVRRLTFFHDGAMIRTLSVPDAPLDRLRSALGIDDSGRIVLHPTSWPISFDDTWLRDPLVRLDLGTGVSDTAFVFDFIGSTDSNEGYAHGRAGSVAITRSGYVVGRNDRPRLEFMNFDGQLVRVLSWEEASAIATEAYWNEYISGQLARDPDHSGEIAARLETSKSVGGLLPFFPNTIPAFLSDDEDRLWVAGYSAVSSGGVDERYRIFSSEGAWLGWVVMPDHSRVLDVRNSRVLVLRFDQFRVPAVAVYRLEEVNQN